MVLDRRAVLRCEVCSRVRFPTEVNREDKHRIRADGKPGRSVRDELREMPDVDASVDTETPEGCSMDAVRAGRGSVSPRASPEGNGAAPRSLANGVERGSAMATARRD